MRVLVMRVDPDPILADSKTNLKESFFLLKVYKFL